MASGGKGSMGSPKVSTPRTGQGSQSSSEGTGKGGHVFGTHTGGQGGR